MKSIAYASIAKLFVFLVGAYGLGRGADIHVAPHGKATGDGSVQAPLDLRTALQDPGRIRPGDTVWLMAGTYQGPFVKPAKPSGTPDQPILYRADPHARVTLTAGESDAYVLLHKADHIWYWGLEISIGGKPKTGGSAFDFKGGRGTKLINLIIHDNPNRSGIGSGGIGNEFYGCLLYRNGLGGKGFGHGIYVQNRPESTEGLETLPWKEFKNCVVFNNFGFGVHTFATSPRLAKCLYEGVVAFGNGLPEGSEKRTVNFLSGGYQFDDRFVINHCYTYYPDHGRFKRGADFGFSSSANGRVDIRNSVFVGGTDAIWLRRWQKIVFQNNLCYTSNGHAMVLYTPDNFRPGDSQIDHNIYHAATGGHPFLYNTLHINSLDAWRKKTGWDQNSLLRRGPPRQLQYYLRANQYEPDKALLIIYNWPKTAEVSIKLDALQHFQAGSTCRITNVENIWGKPVWRGRLSGDRSVRFRMDGAYAPEFACYRLEITDQGVARHP